MLEHHRNVVTAQLAQPSLGHRDDVLAIDHHLASRRLDQPGEAAHQRRLARAGQPHHHEDLAGGDVEAHVADGRGAAGLGKQLGTRQVGVR